VPKPEKAEDLDAGFAEHRKLIVNDKLFYAACFIFVAAIGAGAVLLSINDSTLLDYLSLLTRTGIEARVSDPFYITFINCLIPHLILLLLSVLFANCSFGLPFIISLILFKGISAGLTGGYIYRIAGGAYGVLYNLGILMPPTIIAAAAFIWLAIYCAKSSVILYGIAFKGIGHNMKRVSGDVYHALAVAAVLSCVSAVLETVLFRVFGSFFL
jgi:hypothetical protein